MGPYYLTALVQMLGPVKTVSGLAAEPKTSGELAMGGALGRRSTLPSTRNVSALLEFASGPIRRGHLQLRFSDCLPRT